MKRKMMKVLAALLTFVMALGLTSFGSEVKTKAAGSGYVLQDKSVAELMTSFSAIVFDTQNISSHFHGNYLTKNIIMGSNSGLRTDYNTPEDFYFESADSINSNVSEYQEGTLYTGAELIIKNGTEKFLKTTSGAEQKVGAPATIVTDASIAEQGTYAKYADMADIQSKFIAYNQGIAAKASDASNVTVDITGDMNNRAVTVKSGSVNVISLSYADMTVNTNPIHFYFNDYTNDDILVVNIDLKGIESASFGDLILNDIASAESNYEKKYNRVFFNFYDSSKADGQYTGSISLGRGLGTVIAPKASVTTRVNWDGTVAASYFENGGEFHKVCAVAYPSVSTTTVTKTAEGTFSKTSTTNTKELAGAKLEITADKDLSAVTKKSGPDIKYSTDKKTISWTSTTEALVLSKLPSGKYTMTETTAPKGYKVAETITFMVDGEDILDKNGNKLDGNKLVMKDAPNEASTDTSTEEPTTEKPTTEPSEDEETGSLIIVITDSKTLAPIPDAKVVIRNVDTGKEYLVVTDENGTVPETEYPTGEYEIEVTSVPDGYTAPKAVTATVTAGKVTEKKLTVKKSAGGTTENTTTENTTTEKTAVDGTGDTTTTQDAGGTTATGENGTSAQSSTKPQTGDNSMVFLFGVLLVLSAAGVIVITGRKRNKK